MPNFKYNCVHYQFFKIFRSDLLYSQFIKISGGRETFTNRSERIDSLKNFIFFTFKKYATFEGQRIWKRPKIFINVSSHFQKFITEHIQYFQVTATFRIVKKCKLKQRFLTLSGETKSSFPIIKKSKLKRGTSIIILTILIILHLVSPALFFFEAFFL